MDLDDVAWGRKIKALIDTPSEETEGVTLVINGMKNCVIKDEEGKNIILGRGLKAVHVKNSENQNLMYKDSRWLGLFPRKVGFNVQEYSSDGYPGNSDMLKIPSDMNIIEKYLYVAKKISQKIKQAKEGQ